MFTRCVLIGVGTVFHIKYWLSCSVCCQKRNSITPAPIPGTVAVHVGLVDVVRLQHLVLILLREYAADGVWLHPAHIRKQAHMPDTVKGVACCAFLCKAELYVK